MFLFKTCLFCLVAQSVLQMPVPSDWRGKDVIPRVSSDSVLEQCMGKLRREFLGESGCLCKARDGQVQARCV